MRDPYHGLPRDYTLDVPDYTWAVCNACDTEWPEDRMDQCSDCWETVCPECRASGACHKTPCSDCGELVDDVDAMNKCEDCARDNSYMEDVV